ncbi:transmembrane emp24 domain-containing protein [Anaeramoeba ignava]|uniref:Transmembrane emp24 domain-containing protein n=1 Tax=Anaeramoeba ignava TaxID=1746090 RepID=A0A9Q0LDW1_ANAIG|nr:transmembrane emp24 domain-containing protein [Anaeramoeba ignava]
MNLSIILLIFVVILLQQTNCITFIVPASQIQCFYEDIGVATKVSLDYQVISGGQSDINFQVLLPHGSIFYQEEKQKESKFTFSTNEAGLYSFCFDNTMSSVSIKKINFNLQLPYGIDNTDFVEDKVTGLEKGVVELNERIQRIRSEQRYYKTREMIHRNTTESTNSRVLWFSFLELTLLATMTAIQILYIRKMFETKRRV